MRVPGQLNESAICDVLQFVQQLGGVVLAILLGKSEPIALFEQMAMKRYGFSLERHLAILRASINKQTLAPGPFRAMIERRTVMQPEQTKGRRNRAIFRHGPHRLHRTAVSFKVR